jgi:hypothetical protein
MWQSTYGILDESSFWSGNWSSESTHGGLEHEQSDDRELHIGRLGVDAGYFS